MTNVLFICSRNKKRSLTAEHHFAGRGEFEVASGGLDRDSATPVTPHLLEWADVIFVMEPVHREKLSRNFRSSLIRQRVICLNIADQYATCDFISTAEQEMRTKPPTTTEILALHVLGRRTDQPAVDWAVDLLVRGYDTPALRQLAGESEPFLQYEMATLLRRVFRQLNLEFPDDRRGAIWLLISAQMRLVSEGEIPSDEVLLEISNCYGELGRPESLHDLYLLEIAMLELEYDEYSSFWPEATCENIDQIVRKKCGEWLAEHGRSVELPDPGEV